MIITKVALKNWRNFKQAEVTLDSRCFIVGPNACGKSNFLDIFRFCRDLVKQGGGLQKALSDRGGLSKIRCLTSNSSEPGIELSIHLLDNDETSWTYEIGVSRERGRNGRSLLRFEKVYKNTKLIRERPNKLDKKDDSLLTQTHLEQINSNAAFREIANFFNATTYLHLVPQLIRYAHAFPSESLEGDPFGRTFLEKIAKASDGTREKKLKKIEQALQIVLPQFDELRFQRDEINGLPHLEAIYQHWRAGGAGRQREDQFSDGTLRLIGLFWSLLESNSLLLLEEPELSLHSEIIQKLPSLIYRLQTSQKRQVILTTHSTDLLSDEGISPKEVLIFTPEKQGTSIQKASDDNELMTLINTGFNIGEVVKPKTKPKDIDKLSFFK